MTEDQKRLRNKERCAAYYAANKERMKERARTYYSENTERRKDSQKAWREPRRAEAVERMRQWRLENPERAAILNNKNRAEGCDLTVEQWSDILAVFEGHCAYCDRADLVLVMEHMVPIARGGRTTATNVVPACAPCNDRKHTKTAREFAGWDIPPRLQLLTTP